MLVASEPRLAGEREYINGPAQHRVLTRLPFGQNWRRRIRSASVGARATVTLWADEQFTGASTTLRPDARYDQLPAQFDQAVESLTIRCAPTAE